MLGGLILMYNHASTTGTWKEYETQVVSLQPGDVLLVYISDDTDLDSYRSIMQTLKETFPNNKCMLCNEHVLKGLTVIRTAENKEINDVVDISTNVDVNKLFEEIMKGNPNDFLYRWFLRWERKEGRKRRIWHRWYRQ